MQHALKHVERPGGSHKALDGKKNPKSQNEFYDLLTIPSCSSSTTTNAKGMENGLIFHVTKQIQILTMFSVQSKYSKKTKSISLLGFVISNKTCKT